MIFEFLSAGLDVLLSPLALGLTFIGSVVGLIVGAMPGLGPLMGIILLLPVAIGLPPVAAMGFLIAIFVGGSCGGAVSAILLRIPGTPLAAATLFDGYPMAQKGRASDAIGIAITSSAIGGLIGGVVLVFCAPLLARFASNFAPPEYAMLAIMGLFAIVVISGGSIVKGLLAGSFGLLIATVGTDSFSTGLRFTFGSNNLLNGFHIVAVVVGLFAISEMAAQMLGRDLLKTPNVKVARPGLRTVAMTLKHSVNLLRSSAIGTFFGAIPGAGGVISSFTSYAVAKAAAKPHEKYGEGAEGGVVATEAANNATVGGTLVPTLSLGIPGDASSAMLLGALLILGFIPGPAMFENSPDVVGGIFMVYLVSNVFLLIAGILATPLFVYVLRVPKVYLIPSILLLCSIGTFALQSSVFDLQIMLAFGFIGILFRAADYPLAPVVIGMILGPILEANLRRALLISDLPPTGPSFITRVCRLVQCSPTLDRRKLEFSDSRDGYWIFVDRPVSATLVVINALLLVAMVYLTFKRLRGLKQGELRKAMSVEE